MHKSISIGIIAIVVLGLTLVGCAQPVAPTKEAQDTTVAPAPTPTESPAEAKIATYITWQDFIDLDPAYAFASEPPVLNQCYENLVWYNHPGSEEVLRPGLATKWESNEDATVWTFYLREGVEFQDGTAFTAEAVKATFDYYVSHEGEGCTWIWGAIEKMEVVDDYTVKFHLSSPAAVDLMASGPYCAGIMSPKVVDKPKEWFDSGHCVGTGPYTIESFERGQRLVMTRFEGYWGGWQENQFDKLAYEVVEDQAVGLQMIEGGIADFYRDAPADKIASLASMEHLSVYVQPSMQHMMFMLNTTKPPLDNKLVRQAIAYSFPYDQYIERTEEFYTQSRGAVPQTLWGHGEDLYQYQYDPGKAKELLAQAGYPDGGFTLELNFMANWPQESWAVELWAIPLQELGIELESRGMAFESMWELAQADPTTAQDIFPVIWWPSWPTPYDPLFSLYHCEDEPFWNLSYYCNPDFDAMIDGANELTVSDREAAEQMFIDAQEYLIDDCPAIFVCDFPEVWVVSSDIEGILVNPAYPYVVFFHEVTTTR